MSYENHQNYQDVVYDGKWALFSVFFPADQKHAILYCVNLY